LMAVVYVFFLEPRRGASPLLRGVLYGTAIWPLCRMRYSSHNVESRTMPHKGVANVVITAFNTIWT
jgi:hypothetical protein